MLSEIGDRIRQLRIQNGWLQKELAHRAKISSQKISNIERGYTKEIDATDVARIAEALETTSDYLLYGITPESRIRESIKDDQELLEFFEELTKRGELQLLFKQVKPLKDNTIKRIIKYIKMVEDEEANE